MNCLARHGVSVKVRLDPAAVLLDHAGQFGAGLVVMGAFGHSALREFFFGSTTRGVLRGSTAPVMLYHRPNSGGVYFLVTFFVPRSMTKN